nr:hypothetical protein [uncultured Mediterranean phage uvMED]
MVISPLEAYPRLRKILQEMQDIMEQQNKLHPMDRTITPSMQSVLEYELIPLLENEVDYDPTPQYLYDNTGGEPPVTLDEMHTIAFQQHQEMHS